MPRDNTPYPLTPPHGTNARHKSRGAHHHQRGQHQRSYFKAMQIAVRHYVHTHAARLHGAMALTEGQPRQATEWHERATPQPRCSTRLSARDAEHRWTRRDSPWPPRPCRRHLRHRPRATTPTAASTCSKTAAAARTAAQGMLLTTAPVTEAVAPQTGSS